MKDNRGLWIAMFLLILVQPSQAAEFPVGEYYFAIEMNGTVCGYSKFTAAPLRRDGGKMILLKQEMLMRIAALGARSESRLTLTYHIDPATGRFTYHDSTIEQGDMRLFSKIRIEGGKAFVSGSGVNQEQAVPLPPDVPADLRSCLGKYLFAQAQAEFLVQYENGALLLNNLSAKRVTRLQPQGSEGCWHDESGNLSVRFTLDAKGEAESLAMESITRFRRQDDCTTMERQTMPTLENSTHQQPGGAHLAPSSMRACQ